MAAPTDLSNLKLWCDSTQGRYDATSGGSSVTADAAEVASWEPRAGTVSARLTQATAANRLLYDATKQLLVGDVTRNVAGSRSWFDLPGTFSLDRRAFSFFIVGEFSTCHALAADNWVTLNKSTGDAMNLFIDADTGSLQIYDGSFRDPAARIVPSITRCLVGFVGDASETRFWLNGLKSAGPALSSGSATWTQVLTYGPTIHTATQAGVADLIVYDRALSDSEVTDTLLAFAASDRGVRSSFARTIWFAGDSITHGYGSTCNRGWAQRATLPASARLRGLCYSGETAQWLAANWSTLATPQVAGGDVVVVWAGTNDVGTRTPAQIYTDLSAIVTAVQGAGATAILVTPLPRGAGAIAGDWATLRTSILGNAAGADAVLDPIGDATLAAAWGDGTYDYDDVHPNDAGYALIATLLQGVVGGASAAVLPLVGGGLVNGGLINGGLVA